jgi:hypothetical protein
MSIVESMCFSSASRYVDSLLTATYNRLLLSGVLVLMQLVITIILQCLQDAREFCLKTFPYEKYNVFSYNVDC